MCLKKYFLHCWKVSSVIPVFNKVVERSKTKNYRSVSLLSAVSKVFEKLVNNRIVDHLDKSGLFLISSMVLGILNKPTDLVTVVSGSILTMGKIPFQSQR